MWLFLHALHRAKTFTAHRHRCRSKTALAGMATGLACPDYGVGYVRLVLACARKKMSLQCLALVPFNRREQIRSVSIN